MKEYYDDWFCKIIKMFDGTYFYCDITMDYIEMSLEVGKYIIKRMYESDKVGLCLIDMLKKIREKKCMEAR